MHSHLTPFYLLSEGEGDVVARFEDVQLCVDRVVLVGVIPEDDVT